MLEAGLALVITATVLLGLPALDWPLLRGLETASLDLRFRLRGTIAPGPETTVVLVDDRSLATYGRWPLSRRLYAKAIERLDRAGAELIVFDLLFAEPEQPIPTELRDSVRAAAGLLNDPKEAALQQKLDRYAAEDPEGEFAAAIRNSGRVLLPIAFSFQGEEIEAPPFLSDQAYQQFDVTAESPAFPLQPRSAVLPVTRLAEAAAGLGHVNIAYDMDGAPRYDYVTLPFAGDFLPSLPIRAAAMHLGLPWNQVALALGQGARLGTRFIPTDPTMRLLVNYRGPRGTIPTHSFADLLQGRLPPDLFKGKIVLIGASFIGLPDSNPAPFDNTPMPGTERLANIIDTILARDFIRESPPPWPGIVVIAIVLTAVLAGGLSPVLPTRIAVLATAVPVIGWGIAVQVAFVHGLWLPFVTPAVALAAAMLSVLLFRYGFVDLQRRRIHTAFRHYLHPDLVNTLAANPHRLQLGGETRVLTLMFSDIRGFTAISEQFKSNPQGLSRLINRGFLSPATALIMARHGTIDKYMGDCVMAFWNAPLDDRKHADNACDSALAMVAELDRVNRELEAEAAAENRPYPPIHIGVGINTGECVVGNMGSDQRFAYTAMGDAVNLASRLEGQSKTYHVTIIIGEDTRAAAPSWAALELDLIAVKGKHDAVRIYTLLGDAAMAQSAGFAAHRAHHDRMLAQYRAQDWAAAEAALAECRAFDPDLAGFYDVYAERIAHFRLNPPGPDWDGVFVAETK